MHRSSGDTGAQWSGIAADASPLPVALTSFVGREKQIAELAELVERRRLVTLTGPGGCGKTRLAIEVLADAAVRRGQPVGWVDLATLDDADAIADAAAAALGIAVSAARAPGAALAAGLRDRALLVCFDNCEHVVDPACDLIEQLLRSCPELSVLATSREPLGSAAETVCRVPPMEEHEVVALFTDRAAAARADFETDDRNIDAIRTIGRRLEGIPLAVEFAAAWVRSLTPAQIAAALDDRFDILVGTRRHAIPRHRTLLASVEWSYGLLRDDARTLLPRLSVFAGHFTLDDVAAVCSDARLGPDRVLPGLARLVDTSMIATDGLGARAPYRLAETIRHFAADLLCEAGETATFRDRHLAHFGALAGSLAHLLDESDQDRALAELAAMDQNLRTALEWGLRSEDPMPGCRLAASLIPLWMLRGRAREGIDALERAIDRCPEDELSLQATLLSGLAMLAIPAGRMALSVGASAQAIELARRADDGAALARATAAAGYVPCYTDYFRAEELGREAESHGRAANDRFAVDLGLLLQAISLSNRDRHDEARPITDVLYASALAHNDRFLAFALDVRLYGQLLTGDVRGAVTTGNAAVALAEPLGDHFTHGTMVSDLAWALGMAGDLEHARRLAEPLMRSIDCAGPDVDVMDLRVTVGKLLLWSGDLEAARLWVQRAAEFDDPGIDNWTAMRALPTLSEVLRRLDRAGDAVRAAERGLVMARRLGTPHAEAESLDALAKVLTETDPGRAESLFHEALAVRARRGLWTHVADSLDSLARAVARREDHSQAARLVGASDAARAQIGYPRPPVDLEGWRGFERALEDALGESRLPEMTREGGELTLEQAVAYATRARGPRGRPTIGWDSLTPTEQAVTELVAEGLTNPQIAERLFVSRATVKTHVSHIFAKIGVTTRAELAAAASLRGATAGSR